MFTGIFPGKIKINQLLKSLIMRPLNYDAKSLLFGTNGMIYDKMVAKKGMSIFNDSQIMGYDNVQ